MTTMTLMLKNPDAIYEVEAPCTGLDGLTQEEREEITCRRGERLRAMWETVLEYGDYLELLVQPGDEAPSFAIGGTPISHQHHVDMVPGTYVLVFADEGAEPTDEERAAFAPWARFEAEEVTVTLRAVVAEGMVTFSVVPVDEPDAAKSTDGRPCDRCQEPVGDDGSPLCASCSSDVYSVMRMHAEPSDATAAASPSPMALWRVDSNGPSWWVAAYTAEEAVALAAADDARAGNDQQDISDLEMTATEVAHITAGERLRLDGWNESISVGAAFELVQYHCRPHVLGGSEW